MSSLRVNKQRRRRERRDSFGEAMSFHVAPLNPVSGTRKFPGVMSGAPVEVRPRDWLYRRDHRITIWSELVPAARFPAQFDSSRAIAVPRA